MPLGDPSTRTLLSELILGSFVTQLLYVIAKLQIADLLKQSPMSAGELATRTGANARSLEEMLRALVTLEVLDQDEGGRFRLTAVGELLRSSPGWRSQAMLMGEEYFRASSDLLHTAKTGESAFSQVLGKGFYEYFAGNPEAAERFNEVMRLSASVRYADIAGAYDFSRVATLVDVGAGHGGLASILLRTNPRMRAILIDSAPVTAGARQHLEAQGLAHRCEFVAGDFLESVPPGGDTYVIASVITNWDDNRARRILHNCGAAMGPEARLLLVEPALVGKRLSRYAALFAVAARAVQGSVIRSEREYRELLNAAGFKLASVRPLSYEPWTLMTALPA